MTTTSATDSRQGSSLEWCSYGPRKTTGRRAGGSGSPVRYRSSAARSPSTPTSLLIAPVEPDPQKITTVSSSPPTAVRITSRASSRSRVVCSPVPLDSVCVFAYRGSTSHRMKSSRKPSARPDAV
jgi:hypothetical protein